MITVTYEIGTGGMIDRLKCERVEYRGGWILRYNGDNYLGRMNSRFVIAVE